MYDIHLIYCHELYLTKCQKCDDQIPYSNSNLRCCLTTGKLLDSKCHPLPLASWSRVAGDKQPNLRLKWRHCTKSPMDLPWIYLLSEILLPQFVSRFQVWLGFSMQNCRCSQRLWESWKIFPGKLGPSHRGSGAKWEPSWTCEHVWPALVPESSIVDQLNPKSSNLAVEYLSGSFPSISGLFLWSLDLVPRFMPFSQLIKWRKQAPMTVPVKSALQILYLLDHKKCEPGTRITQITRLFVFDPTSFPGRKLHHWCASKSVATVLAAHLPLASSQGFCMVWAALLSHHV